ncbi:hypothetical protein B0H14DRAFT_2580551 [Mycena olivaceomarginata]|nr:hypothetical protein B0H14DRAFT_2580551 [Mycena olivaceomarginata]
MAPTRTVLDSEAKRARRKETLARYAASIRTQAQTKTQKDGQLSSAAKYREKSNRESIRAADALRRANATWRVLEILGRSESESESESSDSDSEFLNDSPIPGASYGYGAPRPRSLTPPDLDCDCLLPAYCPKCTCGCDYMCCLRHHENESDHRKWMKVLTLEEEQLRQQRPYQREAAKQNKPLPFQNVPEDDVSIITDPSYTEHDLETNDSEPEATSQSLQALPSNSCQRQGRSH